jgi:hypothetical protein
MTIEYITSSNDTLAIIITKDHVEDGLNFMTPPDFSQQLAYMHHPTGKIIKPHTHLISHRNVEYTQEVLVIKRGKLRVDFYKNDKSYIKSRILVAGDIILLAFAGHGFEVIEEVEMIEIKQGPYGGEETDKVKFDPISNDKIIFD